MISNFNQLDSLFEEIDTKLRSRLRLYVIGGAMLLYHGLKDTTKDIDVIVDSKPDYQQMQKVLKDLGFSAGIPTKEYRRVDVSQIYVRDDFRVDLFNRVVCKGLHLSETMKQRAVNVRMMKHLSIYLCSSEDVFLFKTFTDREGDITDCLSIVQKDSSFDWLKLLHEIQLQIKVSGCRIWVTWIGERLDALTEKGLNIPIMKQINKLREEFYYECEREKRG